MTKPPPQTKESIEADISQEQMATLIVAAGQIAAQIVGLYTAPDAVFMATKILGFVIGNTIKPEPEFVNGVLGDTFEHIRSTVINTIRVKQIAEAALNKEADDGQVH